MRRRNEQTEKEFVRLQESEKKKYRLLHAGQYRPLRCDVCGIGFCLCKNEGMF